MIIVSLENVNSNQSSQFFAKEGDVFALPFSKNNVNNLEITAFYWIFTPTGAIFLLIQYILSKCYV